MRIHLFPSDLTCMLFCKQPLSYVCTRHFLESSESLSCKTVRRAVKTPKARRKPGSSEKSKDNFHLDHIRVFADAECRRVGVEKEGPSFLSPTPPLLFSALSLFSSGLLPTGFDSESESHPRSPIPRLTSQPAHYTHLSTPSSICFLFVVLETSSPLLTLFSAYSFFFLS